jgi:hypothetical protein
MSVRLIAQDLYRIIREVENLEKELLAAPAQNQEILQDRLRKAKAERDLMWRSLEGSKDVANVLKCNRSIKIMKAR